MKEEFGGTRPPAPGLRRDTSACAGPSARHRSKHGLCQYRRTARGRDSSAREERVVHGDDVFRRDIGHDVVDLLEDKAAAWIQDLHLFANVVRDLGRRGVGENVARVATAAPEREVVAEITAVRLNIL